MAYGATLTLPAITGSHTDFPVLLKEADFPAGAKDGGANSILNGGGDLRAYTSSAKTTQLPLEVVTFVAGGTPDIEVYVKIPTAATSNTIFIEADATETTQPAVTATYGRNAVWADYESVLHLTESGNGTSGEFADSSGNGVTGKVGRSTSVQKTTGMPWGGNWQELDGNDDYILVENSANLLDGSDFTVQAVWQNLATLTNFDEGLISNWEIAQAANHFRIAPQDDGVDGIAYGVQDGTGDNNAKGTVPAVNDVVYSHLTANASSVRGYEDGSQAAVDTSIAGDNQFVTAKTIKIGTYYDLTSGRSLKCMVGRVRLRLSALSADWIATEHANMDASSNWVTVGTWADSGAAVVVQDLNQAQSLDNVSLTQQNVLSTDDLNQAQQLDNVTLSISTALVVQSLNQVQSLGVVSLIQHNALSVASLNQAQQLDGVLLTQHNALGVNDLLQLQQLDNVTLSDINIIAQDLTQLQQLSGVGLTQQNILVVDALNQAQQLGNVSLSGSVTLFVQDLTQLQQLSVSSLSVAFNLIVDNLVQGQQLSEPAFTQQHVLIVDDMTQAQILSIVSFGAVVIECLEGVITITAMLDGKVAVQKVYSGEAAIQN